MLCAASILTLVQKRGDGVLINGNPSLRQFEVGATIEMLELLLDINFSGGERAAFCTHIVDDWSMGSLAIVKALQPMRELNPKIENASVASLQALRA